MFSTWQFVSVGDLVRWTSSTVSALGSSSRPSALTSGVWIHMAGVSWTTLRLALDPVTKPLTFAPPTCQAPTASCAVSVRNKEEWNADKTDTSVCGDDVLGYDVAHCGCLADHLRVIGGTVVSHHIDARTFCFKSCSLSLCLLL